MKKFLGVIVSVGAFVILIGAAVAQTVEQLIDVSAYVASLRPKDAPKIVSAQGQVVALVLECLSGMRRSIN